MSPLEKLAERSAEEKRAIQEKKILEQANAALRPAVIKAIKLLVNLLEHEDKKIALQAAVTIIHQVLGKPKQAVDARLDMAITPASILEAVYRNREKAAAAAAAAAEKAEKKAQTLAGEGITESNVT